MSPLDDEPYDYAAECWDAYDPRYDWDDTPTLRDVLCDDCDPRRSCGICPPGGGVA